MQKKLQVAICDDDSAARNIITSSLKGAFAGQEIEVRSYSSARILAADLSVHSFDLLLLDIDMPDLDGITFAEGLRQENAAVDIIYISNREDKVFQSLRTEPCGFIRKSRFLEDMNDVISRYLSRRAARGDADIASLVIQDRTCMRNLPLKQIIYVEGLRKIQLVHAVSEPQPLRKSCGPTVFCASTRAIWSTFSLSARSSRLRCCSTTGNPSPSPAGSSRRSRRPIWS